MVRSRMIHTVPCVLMVLSACATGSTDGQCHVEELARFQPRQDQICSLKWSPDGKYLAWGGRGHSISIWEISTGKEVQTLTWPETDRWPFVRSISWSPDGTRLASAANDGSVRIWDVARGEQLHVWQGDNWMICVAWSPDGREIAAGGQDKLITILDAGNGRVLRRPSGHKLRILDLAWSPDGKRLASSGNEDRIRVWEASTGRQLLAIDGHGPIPDDPFSRRWPRVCSISWSPEGNRVVTGGSDWKARIWDAETGRQLVVFGKHRKAMTVAWCPDGTHIASAGRDKVTRFLRPPGSDPTVRIWNSTTGEQVAELPGDGLAWNPDGRRLATVAMGEAVRIWSVDFR